VLEGKLARCASRVGSRTRSKQPAVQLCYSWVRSPHGAFPFTSEERSSHQLFASAAQGAP
jgi:hypothetical protein